MFQKLNEVFGRPLFGTSAKQPRQIVRGRIRPTQATITSVVLGCVVAYSLVLLFEYMKTLTGCEPFFGFSLLGVIAFSMLGCLCSIFYALPVNLIRSGWSLMRNKTSVPIGKVPLFDTTLIEGAVALRRGRLEIAGGVICFALCIFLTIQLFEISEIFLKPVNVISKCLN
jgi:hypothetical protein